MKRCLIFLLIFTTLFIHPVFLNAETIDTAENESEFVHWINEHKTTGGTLQLTDDIFIDGTFTYPGNTPLFRLQDITIQTNGHTVYVRGSLNLTYANYKMRLEGSSENDALIHVLEHGFADLSMIEIYAEDGKASVIQEENSVLSCLDKTEDPQFGTDIRGNVIYARKPVLYSPLKQRQHDVILLSGEILNQQHFPAGIANLTMYDQGKAYDIKYADIVWNPKEYEIRKPYTFYTYHGTLQGPVLTQEDRVLQAEDINILTQPYARVIETKGKVALTGVQRKSNLNYEQQLHMLFVTVPKEPKDYIIWTRTDESQEWHIHEEIRAERRYSKTDNTAMLFLEDDANLLQYYVDLIYEEDVFSTNVVESDSDGIRFLDIEGGRGGGVQILPAQPETPEPAPQQPVVQEKPGISQESDSTAAVQNPQESVAQEKPRTSQKSDLEAVVRNPQQSAAIPLRPSESKQTLSPYDESDQEHSEVKQLVVLPNAMPKFTQHTTPLFPIQQERNQSVQKQNAKTKKLEIKQALPSLQKGKEGQTDTPVLSFLVQLLLGILFLLSIICSSYWILKKYDQYLHKK